MPVLPSVSEYKIWGDIDIMELTVLHNITYLKFLAHILMPCVNTFSIPLTILKLTSSGTLPDEWKHLHVISIFKSKKPSF